MSTLAWDWELRRSHEQRLESAVLCRPAHGGGVGVGGCGVQPNRTRQASFLSQPESWEPPGDKTNPFNEQDLII